MTDKTQSRMQVVSEQLKALELARNELRAAGGDVSDEAYKSAQMEIEKGNLLSSIGGQAAQPEPSQDDVLKFWTDQAQAMEKQAGITIEEDDPELKDIKREGTPQEYLFSYAKALQAKAARLEAEESPPEPERPGRPPLARMPGPPKGGKANPIAHITDPDELFKMAVEEGLL